MNYGIMKPQSDIVKEALLFIVPQYYRHNIAITIKETEREKKKKKKKKPAHSSVPSYLCAFWLPFFLRTLESSDLTHSLLPRLARLAHHP